MADQCAHPGQEMEPIYCKKGSPILHARRVILATIASEMVAEIASKVGALEYHERQFFLESVQWMMRVQRLQDRWL